MGELRDDDRRPLIVICRAVPGEHLGGPDCWCNPYRLDPFDEAAVSRFAELAEHPERQIEA
jgi:hypothetical protein